MNPLSPSTAPASNPESDDMVQLLNQPIVLAGLRLITQLKEAKLEVIYENEIFQKMPQYRSLPGIIDLACALAKTPLGAAYLENLQTTLKVHLWSLPPCYPFYLASHFMRDICKKRGLTPLAALFEEMRKSCYLPPFTQFKEANDDPQAFKFVRSLLSLDMVNIPAKAQGLFPLLASQLEGLPPQKWEDLREILTLFLLRGDEGITLVLTRFPKLLMQMMPNVGQQNDRAFTLFLLCAHQLGAPFFDLLKAHQFDFPRFFQTYRKHLENNPELCEVLYPFLTQATDRLLFYMLNLTDLLDEKEFETHLLDVLACFKQTCQDNSPHNRYKEVFFKLLASRNPAVFQEMENDFCLHEYMEILIAKDLLHSGDIDVIGAYFERPCSLYFKLITPYARFHITPNAAHFWATGDQTAIEHTIDFCSFPLFWNEVAPRMNNLSAETLVKMTELWPAFPLSLMHIGNTVIPISNYSSLLIFGAACRLKQREYSAEDLHTYLAQYTNHSCVALCGFAMLIEAATAVHTVWAIQLPRFLHLVSVAMRGVDPEKYDEEKHSQAVAIWALRTMQLLLPHIQEWQRDEIKTELQDIIKDANTPYHLFEFTILLSTLIQKAPWLRGLKLPNFVEFKISSLHDDELQDYYQALAHLKTQPLDKIDTQNKKT